MGGVDTVGQHWPVDGPRDGDTVADAANAVAELVRYLNHATRSGLHWAADVDAVLAGLGEAMHGLPQVLAQLATFTARQATTPGLYDDRGRVAAATAAVLAEKLGTARGAAGRLATALDAARKHSSHLGNRA